MEWDVEGVRERYAQVAAQWARQLRSYSQSVNLYHRVHRRWYRDQRRTVPLAALEADPSRRPDVRAARDADRSPYLYLVQREEPPVGHAREVLTRRQLEVAGLIARGMTNEQIARELVIATGTAANHVEHILKRLGITNRAAVAAWFIVAHGSRDGSGRDGSRPDGDAHVESPARTTVGQ
jgi:DNA-binding CsgD family transcriptional regulator